MAMTTYKSFEDWFRVQTKEHQALIRKLRALVAKVAPSLILESKWSNGVWMKGDLPLLFIHSKADHLQFGFFAGALLSDPKSLLKGKAKFVRHIPIFEASDIDEAAFSAMIRKAVKAPNYK